MAKKFRFSLEALLSVRGLREREARRVVAAQRAGIVRLDEQGRRIAADIDAALMRLREMTLAEFYDPAAASRCRAWIAQLRGMTAQLTAQRALLVRELERAEAAWRDARQQQRVIEKLRENRWNEHVRARLAEEQRDADDLAQQMQALCRIEGDTFALAANEDRAQI